MSGKLSFSGQRVENVDFEAASALVKDSFLKFVSSQWSDSATENFLRDTAPDTLLSKAISSAYFGVAYLDGVLAGLVLMTKPSFVQMLFVAPNWVGCGIGRYAWEQTRYDLERCFPETKTVELNASTYSIPFYESLGFAKLSREYSYEGCRVTRMACWLPAVKLSAAL